jgi:hypothetical protein
MSTIALSNKAAKLMKLCEAEGFASFDDLLQVAATDSVCPAICMTEGCDYTAEMEPDQDKGAAKKERCERLASTQGASECRRRTMRVYSG